ncbi:MAG: hypothetical protein DHS20C19_15400 [Acidimicrobiales bacterium]|nr:MAG: hypothetical protein DHS20C19_15400 [Acidimicrobiales bacterium]
MSPPTTLPTTTRRRFLTAAAVLPVVGAAPFVLDGFVGPDGSDTETTGEQELRITSNNGRYQAWADPLPEGASIYAPGPRRQSTITVRDQLTGAGRTLTLDRNLEPEAFSPDGATLFAIDHRPAMAPEIYRVSTIDVAAGVVTDTLGPRKLALIEEMRGEGREQVWSPAGDQLYTLYIRQWHDHARHTDSSHDEVHFTDAFVHVLDVANDWALCVELPEGIGLGPAGSTAIMVDETGTTITVVDHALGARIDVTRLADEGAYEVGELTRFG